MTLEYLRHDSLSQPHVQDRARDRINRCFDNDHAFNPRPFKSEYGQVEREFQQQGRAFFHCMMLSFDEARRGAGLIEDVLKVFISGGLLPLRRNHEQETHYISFEYCAKNWLLNSADIPLLPAAMETSHSRRFLCTYMRNELTHDPRKVNIEQCCFLADTEAKSFCASSAAVWAFYHDWVFPFMQNTSLDKCYRILSPDNPDSQTAKDK